ncbi:MAG: polymer-forming cytoskeletal protein [Candidatus Latescibacteria bacterium]|nr:polymer-forming cytoskeletal protein [Candidatus Latescibacterota bacterium]
MFGKKDNIDYTNKDHTSRLDTFVGKSTTLKGDIIIQGSIRIDGQIDGNIEVSETLICGNESFIKGNVTCKTAVIAGRIEGNITAQTAVELQSGANIMGDITCASLIIDKNCFFDGKCHMQGKEKTVKS